MPEYQEILDTEVEPEAPLTSSLGVRFRDNPIAVWEGAPSAPRINGQQGPVVNTGGLFDSAVTTAKINNGSVTAGKINIQQRSFSGTLTADSTTTVSVSDTNPLFPRLTTSENDLIGMGGEAAGGTGASILIKNTSGTFDADYAVAWRYIA